MNKKVLIICIIVVLIIISTIFIINLNNTIKDNKDIENSTLLENENNVANSNFNNNSNSYQYTTEEVEKMKNEINAIANTEIYRVEEELGGRKILQVKPEIQFNVDLAGIIKNGKPEENELNEILKKMPNNTGIWISNQSREKFLELLKNNGVKNFMITNEGYLKSDSIVENAISKKLENMIKSDKLYIINITGKAYERDYITGVIVEYPFEDMDPTQILEIYEKENQIILEVTTNKNKKLSDREILEAIVQY